jgi:hypothetical protein
MNLDAIRAVANAVLYEGYMLYPYRPSALKNRSQGWSFGTLLSPAYVAENPGESDFMQAEVLLRGDAGSVIATEARFLQLDRSRDGTRERSVKSQYRLCELMGLGVQEDFSFISGHTACEIRGILELRAEQTDSAVKLTIKVANRSELYVRATNRDEALPSALIAAHAVITVENGRFISLLDPSEEFRVAVSACKQEGVFPVMVGDEAEQDAMLLSPIILYDYPKVATESKGDFFDSTEIDEMLSLRVLTLSDAEKDEIRSAGGRVSQMLERTEALSHAELSSLHGVMRPVSRSESES